MKGIELAYASMAKDVKKHGVVVQRWDAASMKKMDGGPIPFKNANLEMGTSDPEAIIYSLPQYQGFIEDAELFDSLLLNSIPKITGSGIGALFTTRTQTGTAWKSAMVLDTASRSPVTGSFADTLVRFKILYRSLNISNPLALMSQKTVGDLKLLEIGKQMEELQEVICKEFFYGDESEGNGEQWDGCFNWCDSDQLIHNTDTVGGSSFDLDRFHLAFFSVAPGGPDAIICTLFGKLALTKALAEKQMTLQVGRAKMGFLVDYYLDRPIITNEAITNTQTFDGEGTTDYEADGACTSFFFPKWSKLGFEELLPMGVYNLGAISALHSDYDLWGMRTLKLTQKKGLAILDGVKIDNSLVITS